MEKLLREVVDALRNIVRPPQPVPVPVPVRVQPPYPYPRPRR